MRDIMAKDRADYSEETTILSKISKDYVEDHVYLSYIPPPFTNGKGALTQSEYEEWCSRISEIQEDLIWLLELPYLKFWSQFAFDERVIGLLNSYIQNTPRPYELEEFYEGLDHKNASSVLDAQDRVHALVLAIYIRLSSYDDGKESKLLLTASEFASLIYDRFIFDIPTICDICLIYGGENRLEVSKIVATVFGQQPLYLRDLSDAVICATNSLKETMQKSRDLVSLIDGPDSALIKNVMCMTPLLDIVNYLIDVIFSMSAVIELYSSICNILLKYRYVSLIGEIYYNTIPLLYSHAGEISILVESGKIDSGEHHKVTRKLRVLREEILKTLNSIIAHFVSESLKCKSDNDEDGVKKCVTNFLDVWCDCLPFDTLVRDYNKLYAAQTDFLVLKEVNSSEIESDKISFVMESIFSHEILEKKSRYSPNSKHEIETEEAVANVTEEINENNKVYRISDLELQCRISSVSDILPDVDVDVIRNYLSVMDYSAERVIDAILKNSIAGIPLDENKSSEVEDSYVRQRINVFDGDEFDIMTNDHIDMTRVNLGKKRDKYKDFKELMDDKSHRVEMADMYNRLGVVSEIDPVNGVVDTYDDEYDDTYDDTDVSNRKTFVTPRVLRELVLDSSEDSESEDSEESPECAQKSTLHFVVNPAEVREKMEQKRLSMRGAKVPGMGRDVVGKPKGAGQDQATVLNRQRKNTNKAARANHHRKNQSLRKQQQGMY